MMTPEQRELRRIDRWWRSLTPNQRRELKASLTPERLAELRAEGLIDEHNRVTERGKLRIHQLRLREWMAKKYEKEAEKATGVKKSIFNEE